MSPIDTRVGLIQRDDNRFCGQSAFQHWVNVWSGPFDANLAALGIELTPLNREAMRLITVASTSPDARVWPLKLSRLLSSWGDATAGYFGSQLVTAGKVMGPGAVLGAAQCLSFLSAHLGEDFTVAEVAARLAEFRAANPGPVGGFGVPFRPADERRVALLGFVGSGPLRRRHWRIHELLDAARPNPQTAPNVGLAFAALLLDAGAPAERCGLVTTLLMSHVFLAHAVEAADTDGAPLNAWPVDAVKYEGVAARTLGERRAANVPAALRRAS